MDYFSQKFRLIFLLRTVAERMAVWKVRIFPKIWTRLMPQIFLSWSILSIDIMYYFKNIFSVAAMHISVIKWLCNCACNSFVQCYYCLSIQYKRCTMVGTMWTEYFQFNYLLDVIISFDEFSKKLKRILPSVAEIIPIRVHFTEFSNFIWFIIEHVRCYAQYNNSIKLWLMIYWVCQLRNVICMEKCDSMCNSTKNIFNTSTSKKATRNFCAYC